MSIGALFRSGWARAATQLLVLAGPIGCGSGAEPAASAGSTADAGPRVELGTGRTEFEPVAPDGHVSLIMGLQGGYHVWTSFVAHGFASDRVRMQLHTRWEAVAESGMDMGGNVALQPALDEAGASVSLGWPASIFDPTCANGQRIWLDISISDASGLMASDSQPWIVDVAEEYRSSDCGS